MRSNLELRHPSVLAAMAGRNDGDFCCTIGNLGVGMVTVGGISVDETSMKASRRMVERGRKEFLFNDLYSFLERNISKAQESKARVCVNIRSATVEGYVAASEMIADLRAIVEINAHCRQEEMMEIGAGQHLLKDVDTLKTVLDTLKDIGVRAVLKFRGNVVPEREFLERVQPDSVHIDAYREGEKGLDFSVFERIRDLNCYKIGNNSVNTPEIALKVLKLCDAFSFAQIARNTETVKTLVEEIPGR